MSAASRPLPTGTVTFFFSDIEGSTRLLSALGTDRYEAILADHYRLLRDVFARHSGAEVGTEGDSFFVAFSRAQDAATAAIDALRALDLHTWPDGLALKVRIGLHTCEARVVGADYVGIGVHRAARICAAAHGGQIVVSKSTQHLLDDETTIDCVVLGEHALKDFEKPQSLFQIAHPALRREFPPLRTLDHRPTNLAEQATPLIGRDDELAAVCALVVEPGVRMVTLTGPGGTGKTRLALQVSMRLLEEFEHGVFLVPLAEIRDGSLLAPAIARTLGLSESAGQALGTFLAAKRMLLVLDNLEQIDGAGQALADILVGASRVKLIGTSREPLRIAAERVFRVPPLPLPDLRHLDSIELLAANPAIRLFVLRAQAVEPSFSLTADNRAHVAELCVRLDGLPLALELAAARVPTLSPQKILSRLGERLRLLTGGSRDQPARQQTMRNALAWSYDLLSADERALYLSLAVFHGGFSLEAAESIANADLDILASLVDKSLVRRDGERFAMLESVREHAGEHFAQCEDTTNISARHAMFFVALAEAAHARRWHHEQEGLERLTAEHANIRAALNYLLSHDPHAALRLGGALGWYWHLRSHFTEGRAWLESLLALPQEKDVMDDAKARALGAAGELAAWAADPARAQPMIDAAIGHWQKSGASREIAFALLDLGWGNFYVHNDSGARELMEQSVALLDADGDPLLKNRARCGLMQVLVGQGELDLVEPMAHEALALAERHADLRSAHFALHFLADCALIREDAATAAPRYLRSFELAVTLGDRAEIGAEMQGLSMTAALSGDHERALRLGGAAAAEFDALAIDLSGMHFWMRLLTLNQGRARVALGERAADAAWESGRRMGFDRAVADVLGAAGNGNGNAV